MGRTDIDRYSQPVEDIRIVSRQEGVRTLLPSELIDIGKSRVASGEDLDEVSTDLAMYEVSMLGAPDVDIRALGGPGSGNFNHSGRPGERGGSDSDSSPEQRSERSMRALKAFIPIHAAAQQYAEANEEKVRKMVGGTRTTGNAPVDVVAKINGKTKGIEVKTMINNTNNKITMRRDAMQKKTRWARSNRASVHTVVLDHRGVLGHSSYSGHDVYHSKGHGSFRLNTMTKVTSAKHLKELLSK